MLRLSYIFLLLFVFQVVSVSAQEEKGTLSGNLMLNNQFFQRDDRIGANTELYTRYLSSTDAWLTVNYGYKGFNFTTRFDGFLNSNLYNPSKAYTNTGLGFWQVTKDIENLKVTAGYFYDQFGTGTLFRAYEDRNLGIDYAIQGVRLQYEPVQNLRIKAFSGRQKFRFGFRDANIKGINAEYTKTTTKGWILEPGVSFINRTLDENSMNSVVSTINNQPLPTRFYPKFNMFGWNVYTQIGYKKWRLFLEYSGKSKEAIKDLNADGQPLVYKGGQVYYASLSYSQKGLGVNFQYKRIESFPMRTSPNELQLNGVLNYLPSITRQNTYRLLARYNAVVQEMGETDLQADLLYTFKNKQKLKTQLAINAAYITDLKGNELFHELYFEISKEFTRKTKVMLGVQNIGYNQQVYEVKPHEYPFVRTITPFGEVNYKFSNRKAFRIEFQYLHVPYSDKVTKARADLGSFVNVLAEYSIAPSWSFSVGDMVNIVPYRVPTSTISPEKLHYYTFFTAYTHHATRFTLGYVKQVEGVNCTGGVCRVEPAFSGVKFTCSTNF